MSLLMSYMHRKIGTVAIISIFFILPSTPALISEEVPFWRRALRLDWIGTFLSVAMATMILLPLQWGGNQKAWNDPAVIATFVMVR